MIFKWIFLSLLLIGLTMSCPPQCRCSLDERGRRRVTCEKGHMTDPIPVLKMAADTEVLVITSETHPNSLTLGPIFRNLRNLEEIQITFSGIPALGDHSLWGLHRLHALNLSHNEIESLRSTNFRGAVSLKRLDLSHNRIESIPSAVFRNIKHLRHLRLAHNRLSDLAPRIFFSLSHLEHIDLSYNPLGDLLPERFTDVPELKTLECSGCGLTVIGTSILEILSKLRYMDLSNNRLTQVPHQISILKDILVLRLDGNHISFIEKNILVESNLKKIFLSHNRIIRVESKAFYNTSLSHLDLSYNRLPHLEPGALDDVLGQLVDLRLSGNSLYVDELKNILIKAKMLKHLSLGEMGLTRIPKGLLIPSKQLHYLNISANYLQTIPVDILQSAPHLKILDLSLNSFRGVEEDLIHYFSNARDLRIIKLEGNPWHCDQCHISAILNWLQGAPDQESGCQEPRVWTCLKCVGPKGFSGASMSLLPMADLPSCYLSKPVRPTWTGPTVSGAVRETPPRNSHSDSPKLPHGTLTLHEREWSFEQLLEEQFFLVVGVACSIIFSVFILVFLAIVVYHRQSAFYYTNESDALKNGKVVNGHLRNNNEPNNGNETIAKEASIATIDELTNIAGSYEILDSSEEILNETERELNGREHS